MFNPSSAGYRYKRETFSLLFTFDNGFVYQPVALGANARVQVAAAENVQGPTDEPEHLVAGLALHAGQFFLLPFGLAHEDGQLVQLYPNVYPLDGPNSYFLLYEPIKKITRRYLRPAWIGIGEIINNRSSRQDSSEARTSSNCNKHETIF